LRNDSSLKVLFDLTSNNIITKSVHIEILNEFLKESDISQNTDYLILLNYFGNQLKLDIDKNILKSIFQGIFNGSLSTRYTNQFTTLIHLFDIDEFSIDDVEYFSNFIWNTNKNLTDINKLIELYNYLEIDDYTIAEELNELVTDYIKEELESERDSIYDVQFEESMNEDGYFEVLDGEVESIINDKYDEIESDINYYFGYEINDHDIKDSIYIEDIKSRLSSDYTSERYHDYVNDKEDVIEYSSTYREDDIDDLFERR